MKQEIKVGDWVKLPDWEEFYEVMSVSVYELVYRTSKREFRYQHYKNRTWIIKEKDKPVKIEMNKKYRRVGTHEPVRVICVDRKVDDDSLPCVGLWLTKPNVEAMVYFDHSGVDQYGQKSIEEVPAVDWSKVKVDTPMWVKFERGTGIYHKRHFNKFEGGRVHFWPNGYTSFTSSMTSDANPEPPENCSLEEPR